MYLPLNILLEKMAQWLNDFDVKNELAYLDFFRILGIQFSYWLLSIGTMHDVIPLILHPVNL